MLSVRVVSRTRLWITKLPVGVFVYSPTMPVVTALWRTSRWPAHIHRCWRRTLTMTFCAALLCPHRLYLGRVTTRSTAGACRCTTAGAEPRAGAAMRGGACWPAALMCRRLCAQAVNTPAAITASAPNAARLTP